MEECIFCQIARGDLPCYKVYQDELFFGFLDIAPRTLGHTLLIPKKHYRWVYDITEFDKFWQAVLKITRAMKRALKPYFITYVTHGLEVPHAHIHILPRDETETAFVPAPIRVDKQKMEETAKKIFDAIKKN